MGGQAAGRCLRGLDTGAVRSASLDPFTALTFEESRVWPRPLPCKRASRAPGQPVFFLPWFASRTTRTETTCVSRPYIGPPPLKTHRIDDEVDRLRSRFDRQGPREFFRRAFRSARRAFMGGRRVEVRNDDSTRDPMTFSSLAPFLLLGGATRANPRDRFRILRRPSLRPALLRAHRHRGATLREARDLDDRGIVLVGESWADDPTVPNDGLSTWAGTGPWPHAYQAIAFVPSCSVPGRLGLGLTGLGYSFPTDRAESVANGVSPDGRKIVGWCNTGAGARTEAALFGSDGTKVLLGKLPGHESSAAREISGVVHQRPPGFVGLPGPAPGRPRRLKSGDRVIVARASRTTSPRRSRVVRLGTGRRSDLRWRSGSRTGCPTACPGSPRTRSR